MVKTILHQSRQTAETGAFSTASTHAHAILEHGTVRTGTSLSGLAEQLEAAQLCLTHRELTDGQTDFASHYRSKYTSSRFANPLTVSWAELDGAAQSCGIPKERLALYLIHRYDTATNSWYLTAEFCQLAETGTPVDGGTEYALTHTGNFVDVKDGGLAPTQVSALGTSGTHKYGLDYFDAVEYSADGITFEGLTADNTRACTFCWFEFEMMFKHNCADRNRDDAHVALCFSAITSDYSQAPDQSLVTFPHGLTIHARYQNGDLLNNGDFVVTSYFENKAGDYQTLCPPRCDVYVKPSGLVYI